MPDIATTDPPLDATPAEVLQGALIDSRQRWRELVDLAADRLGIDPAALRRRNMIPPGTQPYTNALGLTYDSGDYPAAMERALELADWNGFAPRRDEARRPICITRATTRRGSFCALRWRRRLSSRAVFTESVRERPVRLARSAARAWTSGSFMFSAGIFHLSS